MFKISSVFYQTQQPMWRKHPMKCLVVFILPSPIICLKRMFSPICRPYQPSGATIEGIVSHIVFFLVKWNQNKKSAMPVFTQENVMRCLKSSAVCKKYSTSAFVMNVACYEKCFFLVTIDFVRFFYCKWSS